MQVSFDKDRQAVESQSFMHMTKKRELLISQLTLPPYQPPLPLQLCCCCKWVLAKIYIYKAGGCGEVVVKRLAGELLISQLHSSSSSATCTTTTVLLMPVSFIHMTIKREVVVKWWRRGWGAVDMYLSSFTSSRPPVPLRLCCWCKWVLAKTGKQWKVKVSSIWLKAEGCGVWWGGGEEAGELLISQLSSTSSSASSTTMILLLLLVGFWDRLW